MASSSSSSSYPRGLYSLFALNAEMLQRCCHQLQTRVRVCVQKEMVRAASAGRRKDFYSSGHFFLPPREYVNPPLTRVVSPSLFLHYDAQAVVVEGTHFYVHQEVFCPFSCFKALTVSRGKNSDPGGKKEKSYRY